MSAPQIPPQPPSGYPNSSFPILNPMTALAYLPPVIADQIEISRYIYVGAFSAFMWDVLTNLNNDYKLLFKFTVRPPTVVYFLSRIMTLAFLTSAMLFPIASIGDCQKLQTALGSCFAVAVPATSLLFFFRVRAIFEREKIVVGIFFLVWLATLGGSLTVPFAIFGGHIGPTLHCINTAVKPYSSVGIIVSTVSDTLVLLAISYRLITTTSLEDSVKGRVQGFFGGKGLPRISKSLLQGGQQYYLITVGFNIATMAMILSPSVPPVLRAILTVPNLALENAMACRVFRDVRFGLIRNDATIQSSRPNGSTLPSSYQYSRKTGQSGTLIDSVATRDIGGVSVTKSIQELRDPIRDPIPMNVMFPGGKSSSDRDSSEV
ncbi:hypothetical protein BD410DRAFT_789054 [Rickenella mellea]|uniref:Uncharacterized protein n=1 Tax=Rickenella mellea TaxID=50990 RepID=A0A4Y7Q570_9AGAM|nr:hypothetical protein BD410DRAFT_789054 [Rickenella mellea]